MNGIGGAPFLFFEPLTKALLIFQETEVPAVPLRLVPHFQGAANLAAMHAQFSGGFGLRTALAPGSHPDQYRLQPPLAGHDHPP